MAHRTQLWGTDAPPADSCPTSTRTEAAAAAVYRKLHSGGRVYCAVATSRASDAPTNGRRKQGPDLGTRAFPRDNKLPSTRHHGSGDSSSRSSDERGGHLDNLLDIVEMAASRTIPPCIPPGSHGVLISNGQDKYMTSIYGHMRNGRSVKPCPGRRTLSLLACFNTGPDEGCCPSERPPHRPAVAAAGAARAARPPSLHLRRCAVAT